MKSETYIRTQSRGAAVQAYHTMLAALHEKSRTFSFTQEPIRMNGEFPFRDNLCREVALLACRELNPEDTRLVFEFLGLTPFIHVDLSGTSLEPEDVALARPCAVSTLCEAIVHVFECPRNSA